ADEPVLTWNREALQQIAAPAKRLIVVPGAGHLFEEPGALEEVARLAAAWFTAYLTPRPRPRPAPTGAGDLPFADRVVAGQVLASELKRYAGRDDVLVLALPRGGVPVGAEVARALGAPLDVFLVRKLGAPGQPELAMGAVATGGVRVLNTEVVSEL